MSELNAVFVSAILPVARQVAFKRFRFLPSHDREEAIATVVALCWQWSLRLVQKGRDPAHIAGALARFAVKRVYTGHRPLATDYCSLPDPRHARPCDPQTLDALPYHTRTRPATQAAFRIDFQDWHRRLSPRVQSIIGLLAIGCSTSETAKLCSLPASRISELRNRLRRSWSKFQA